MLCLCEANKIWPQEAKAGPLTGTKRPHLSFSRPVFLTHDSRNKQAANPHNY